MSKLIFNAADVRRVVEHSISAPRQAQIADWSKANKGNDFTPAYSVPTAPHVILVHDDGVYLMSNGEPRDIVGNFLEPNDPRGRSFAAYAKGCDPNKDGDACWDNSRGMVGGDDFGEHLAWANEIKQMLDDGASHIIVNFSPRRLSLSARYPAGRGPKKQPVSSESALRQIMTKMKRQVVGFDTTRNVLVVYKIAPGNAGVIARLQEKQPHVTILNGATAAVIADAAQKHAERAAAAAA